MPDAMPKELLALMKAQNAESWQWEEKFEAQEEGEFWTVFVPNTEETEDAGKGLATPNVAAKRGKWESIEKWTEPCLCTAKGGQRI
jgi:hypothetical protein